MEIVLHLMTIFLMVAGIVVNASRIRYFNMSNIRKTPFKSTVVVVLYFMLPSLIFITAAGLMITFSRYLYLVSTAESPVNVIFPVTLVLALTGLIVGLTWFDGWLQRTPTCRQMMAGKGIFFNMFNIRKTPFKSTVVAMFYLMLPLLIISTAAGLVITSSRYLGATAESPVNVIFPVMLVLALTGLIAGLTWFDGWLQRTPTWRQMAPGRRIPHT